MRLLAALFDMDGTLVDSERVILNAWMDSSREFGVPLDPVQYSQVIGLNDEESNQLLITLLGSESTFLSVRSLARSKLHASPGNVVFPLKSGVLSLLGELRRHNVPCAVASSSTSAEIEDRLTRNGVWQYFGAAAGGNEVHRGKPDPAVYLLAASRLGVAPSQCIAFEDSEHGAAAAAAAGAQVVLVPDITALSAELATSVHMVLRSLDEAVPLVKTWFAAGMSNRGDG
ncbi:HAD family hydrolase [Gemmatimonas sp.]|jgi:beta-phosphoglucomutase-like phosphatase (HAD superfamily)|uniref:HAD family hydrolase n=1 Tax=Gemmatimonas sp. TaxID=1962908 RepID=UPI003F70D4B2